MGLDMRVYPSSHRATTRCHSIERSDLRPALPSPRARPHAGESGALRFSQSLSFREIKGLLTLGSSSHLGQINHVSNKYDD